MTASAVIGGKISKAGQPPASATNGFINLTGVVSALATLLWLRDTSVSWQIATVICMAATAAPIALLEFVFLKVHRRSSTGLDFTKASLGKADFARLSVKLLGLYGTFGVIAAIYRVVPEYELAFYQPFMDWAVTVVPYLVVLAVPYFAYVDRRQIEPRDGYWHFGMILLGQWRGRDRVQLREHFLGWAIKVFYLPLMLIYLGRAVRWLMENSVDFALTNFTAVFAWSAKLGIFVDLCFGTIGYVLTLRLLDSHIRSSNPLFFGWFITIVCYAPFWGLIGARYFKYDDGLSWIGWLDQYPVLLMFWGTAILVFMAIWVWANMTFGLRFSNLTHRGILTNGPFRYTKHPSYVTKNIYWWMLSVPFISHQGWDNAVGNCTLILGVNAIYYLRARIEEKHLSEDPVYVEYALWIDRHGIFRWLGKPFPWLRYRPPNSARMVTSENTAT